MVFVIGEENTGKSTLKDLLMEVLGDIVSDISLESLDRDIFASGELEGKRALLISEKPNITLKRSDFFKKIVGDRNIPIRKMHKGYVRVKNVLKVICFMNALPIFEKIDSALADRIVIIYTQNPLSETEKIGNILDTMLKEKESVFEFLLYCLYELKKRNYVIERDKEMIRELLTEAKSPVYRWIREYIVEKEGVRTYRKELYDAYVKWCLEHNITKPLSNANFYAAIRSKFDVIEKKDSDGNYYFPNITLKDKIPKNAQNTLT